MPGSCSQPMSNLAIISGANHVLYLRLDISSGSSKNTNESNGVSGKGQQQKKMGGVNEILMGKCIGLMDISKADVG